MPAFAYLSRFREGQWRSFRTFMLQERRDASARFAVIDAERERIGDVSIIYEAQTNADGNTFVSERRVGISIDPDDSSLAKLVAAYVSLGGNPFDISMFLSPDTDLTLDGKRLPTQPGGGILHGNNVKYAFDQGVNDGDTNLKKYRGSRSGGKKNAAKQHEIAAIMGRARGWISAEIRYKRTRIEERILKLCDLREQLDQEVEDLVWATYGDMLSDRSYDSVRYTDGLTIGNIAYFFDSTFRIPDTNDIGRVEYDNEANAGSAGAVNTFVLGGYEGLISDDDDEDNTAL